MGIGLAHVSEKVLPNQYGVGIGADVLAHRINARIQAGLANVLIKLDAVNAFNALARRAIMRECGRCTPELLQLVKFCYGAPTILLVTTDAGGVERIYSREGVQQGCNLGALMMSLVMSARIAELLKECPELDVDAYIDDVFGLAKLQDPSDANIQALLDRILSVTSRPSWQEDGITINATKTVARSSPQLEAHPVKVVGAWVGGGAATSELMCAKLLAKLPPLERIRLLPKQLALVVIRSCCIPLTQFWLRTHPPRTVQAAAQLFDDWVLKMLGGITGLQSLNATSTAIAGLPLREGGLGLLPQTAVSHHAFAASQVAAIVAIKRRAEARAELMSSLGNCSLPDGHLLDWMQLANATSVNTVAAALEIQPEDIWEQPFATRQLQHRLTKLWGRAQWKNVLVSLPTLASQHRFIDLASPIGRGWLNVVPTRPMHSLDNSAVCLALRLRLQQGVYPDYSPLDGPQCLCATANATWDPEHALACMHGAAISARTLRHHYVKNVVAAELRSAGLHPNVEAPFSRRERARDGRNPLQMDIVVAGLHTNSVDFMDVSIRCPIARIRDASRAPLTADQLEAQAARLHAQRNTPGAPQAPDSAHTLRSAAVELLIAPSLAKGVTEKKTKYDNVVRQITDNNQVATASFTPFILSTGGTEHSSARKLLLALINCCFERQRSTAYDHSTVASSVRSKTSIASSLYRKLSCAFVRNLPLFFPKATPRP